MNPAQQKIAAYLDGKTEPTPHDLLCFVGMLEQGEAWLSDFEAVGGKPLAAAVQNAARQAIRVSVSTDKTMRQRQQHEPVREIATILSKLLTDQVMADLMNSLLCCDAEPSLSDAESETGARLFDLLTEMRPDAVSVAVRG